MVLQADGKPLIEYSLEGGRKQHTYTCEQNAKILLRLERQRQLKKVMVASTGKVVILHFSNNMHETYSEYTKFRQFSPLSLASTNFVSPKCPNARKGENKNDKYNLPHLVLSELD